MCCLSSIFVVVVDDSVLKKSLVIVYCTNLLLWRHSEGV